jgi:hypothetical protein
MQETIVKIWRQYPSHPVCHVETDMQLPVIRRSGHNHDSHLHPRLASRVLVLMHTFVGNLQVIKKTLPVADVGLSDDFQRLCVPRTPPPVLFSSGLLFRVLSVCSSYILYSTVLWLACPIQSQSLAQQMRPHG